MMEFKVNARGGTGRFAVNWTEGDRRRHVWVSDAGVIDPTIYCNPLVHDGRPYTTGKLNLKAKAHAKTFAALSAQLPDLVQRAEAARAEEAAERSRQIAEAAKDDFVAKLAYFSVVKAAWAKQQFESGRALDAVAKDIQKILEAA